MLRSRVQRVQELIKEEVGNILQFEIKDPRLGFVTVCRTKVSKDLRNALIFVSVLDEEEADETMEALASARGFIKKRLGERIVLKFMPEIKFIKDENTAYAARISKLIDEIVPKDDAATDSPEAGEAKEEDVEEDKPIDEP